MPASGDELRGYRRRGGTSRLRGRVTQGDEVHAVSVAAIASAALGVPPACGGPGAAGRCHWPS